MLFLVDGLGVVSLGKCKDDFGAGVVVEDGAGVVVGAEAAGDAGALAMWLARAVEVE